MRCPATVHGSGPCDTRVVTDSNPDLEVNMSLRSRIVPLVIVALLSTAAATASPVTDGTLDVGYGTVLVTQTTQTDLGDASQGLVDFAYGSELDAAYGYIGDGVLHLFLSGNLMFQERGMEPGFRSDEVDVYVDSETGGQNVLRADNPAVGSYHSLSTRAGLRFDTAFAPDHWFNGWLYSAGSNLGAPYAFKLYAASLPTEGGGSGGFLGQSSPGGPGALTGGTNPDGIEAAMDNRNVAGVTAGCDAAGGEGATTGIELAIPLAAIGNPTGCVRVCALLVSYWGGGISNQVLGPIPAGTCEVTAPANVDFSAVAGEQFFEVCPGRVPALRSSWGSVKTLYR
jgi:hypothetical protein